MSVALSIPPGKLHRDPSVERLAEIALESGQCRRTRDGALVLHTGRFTGRAVQDRFIALDDETRGRVEWGPRNQPLLPSHYAALKTHVAQHLARSDVYEVTAHAGGVEGAPLTLFTTSPAHALFARHLFQAARPHSNELDRLTVLHAPECLALPGAHGTNSGTFSACSRRPTERS